MIVKYMIVMLQDFIFVSVSYWKSTICYRRIKINISPDWRQIEVSAFFLGLNFFCLHKHCFFFWAPVIPYGILFLQLLSNIKFSACHIS